MISPGLPELVGDWSTSLSHKVAGLGAGQVDRLALGSLARTALALAQMHGQLWETTRAALAEGGCEARELVEHCRFLLRLAEANAQTYERLRALAEARGLTGGALPELQELAEQIDAATARRAPIADVLAFAGRPPQPVDEGKLAAAEAAFASGRYTTGKDVIARLRSPKGP